MDRIPWMRYNKLMKNTWSGVLARIFSLAVLVLPALAFAADPNCRPEEGMICNPIPGIGSIPEFIKMVLEGAIKIGIPLIALAIIYAGFLFVFARGNSEKLGKAKDALLYSIIGGAILLGSWAIAQFISNTVDTLK
jgi:hypothetical protein